MPEQEKQEQFTAEVFLRDTPLYDERSILGASDEVYKLYNGLIYDGHCPSCGKHATFTVVRDNNAGAYAQIDPKKTSAISYRSTKIVCTRNNAHVQEFFIRSEAGTYTKVGQYPSLADIVIDENKKYRSVLTGKDSQEFYKAIGLAAHGVGIGSFVYLRRIFERLVGSRFQAHADDEGWKLEDYQNKRMNERVAFLKNYLPEFLVKNSAIYGILSLGIHELDEQDCLKFFPVLKTSIGMILEEDFTAKEEDKARQEAQKALAKFQQKKN